MFRPQKKLLLCEKEKQLELILSSHLEKLDAKIISSSNEQAIPVIAKEHKPDIILINIDNPLHLGHLLKIHPSLYYIPLFVFLEPGTEENEIQFLSNEIIHKPINEIKLIEKIKYYLSLEKSDPSQPLLSQTKEKWIEKKIKDSYIFEYVGNIKLDNIETLRSRIQDLLAIGRNDFVVNLINSQHIENVSASIFHNIREDIKTASGHLKILMQMSSFAEELSRSGIDIDEYVKKD
ncbi:MAG: response regulator [Spirochaetes bacterium]|nr:response regulator [Spirochaetota bacterium]